MPNAQSWESSSFLRSQRPEGFQKPTSGWITYKDIFFLFSSLPCSASRLLVASLIASDILQDFEHATIKIMRLVYKFSLCLSSLPFFPSWETHEWQEAVKGAFREAGAVNRQIWLTEKLSLQHSASLTFRSLG